MTGTTRRWNPAPAPEPPAQAGPPTGAGPHGPGRLIGYARVSTLDQHPEMQEKALKDAGCETIYTDHGVSGKLAARPQLDACLADLRGGDTLVVWKLDRLGRSLRHLVNTVDDLRERGVQFRSLTEAIDTSTNGGRMVFGLFAVLADFERGLIVERTMAGLALARSKGIKGGHPRSLTDEQAKQARHMIREQGQEVTAVARVFAVSRMTVYRSIDRLERQEAAEGGKP